MRANDAEQSEVEVSRAFLTATWQVSLFLGIVTLVIGVIVAIHPTQSLNVISVLIGILLIISGVFHLVRVFDARENHRVWLGIAGILLVVIGVVLIRHLDLTRALIGLLVGLTWIVQGIAALIAGFGGSAREGRGWWIFFGIFSLIAGIVVVAVPDTSITVLAVLIGIYFSVIGVLMIISAFVYRHRVKQALG